MPKKILILLIVILTISGIYLINKNEKTTTETINKKTTTETIKEKTNEIVATIDGVSVRSSNSANSEYLGSLMTNDKVIIEEVMPNGWYKIKYKDSYAYISSTHMKPTSEKTKLEVLNTGKAKNNLNLKSKSDKLSSTVDKISKDTTVEIVDVTNNGWYKIKYNDKYAYVESSSIKITDSKRSSTEKTTNLNDFLFIGDSYT